MIQDELVSDYPTVTTDLINFRPTVSNGNIVQKQHVFFIFMIALASLFGSQSSKGQIQMHLNSEIGTWIPFLPDYRAGSIVNTARVPIQRDVYTSEIIDVGMNFGLNGHFHLAKDSRWMIDFDLNLASANSTGSTQFVADPGFGQSVWFPSLDGMGFTASRDGGGVTFSLDSDSLFYGEYAGIRRQLNASKIGLEYFDFGGGFTHSAIEQEHLLTANFDIAQSQGRYIEDLDSTYLGGEIRSKMIKRIMGGVLIVDWGMGFLWMHGDYEGTSIIDFPLDPSIESTATEVIDAFAVSVDFALKTEHVIFGKTMRPGISFKYISDIATINHPQTLEGIVDAPLASSRPADSVSLTTSSGYFLGLNLEVDLY